MKAKHLPPSGTVARPTGRATEPGTDVGALARTAGLEPRERTLAGTGPTGNRTRRSHAHMQEMPVPHETLLRVQRDVGVPSEWVEVCERHPRTAPETDEGYAGRLLLAMRLEHHGHRLRRRPSLRDARVLVQSLPHKEASTPTSTSTSQEPEEVARQTPTRDRKKSKGNAKKARVASTAAPAAPTADPSPGSAIDAQPVAAMPAVVTQMPSLSGASADALPSWRSRGVATLEKARELFRSEPLIAALSHWDGRRLLQIFSGGCLGSLDREKAFSRRSSQASCTTAGQDALMGGLQQALVMHPLAPRSRATFGRSVTRAEEPVAGRRVSAERASVAEALRLLVCQIHAESESATKERANIYRLGVLMSEGAVRIYESCGDSDLGLASSRLFGAMVPAIFDELARDEDFRQRAPECHAGVEASLRALHRLIWRAGAPLPAPQV